MIVIWLCSCFDGSRESSVTSEIAMVSFTKEDGNKALAALFEVIKKGI
jgi:hypothetical protein